MDKFDIRTQNKVKFISEYFNIPGHHYKSQSSYLEQRNFTSKIKWEAAEFTYIKSFQHCRSLSKHSGFLKHCIICWSMTIRKNWFDLNMLHLLINNVLTICLMCNLHLHKHWFPPFFFSLVYLSLNLTSVLPSIQLIEWVVVHRTLWLLIKRISLKRCCQAHSDFGYHKLIQLFLYNIYNQYGQAG